MTKTPAVPITFPSPVPDAERLAALRGFADIMQMEGIGVATININAGAMDVAEVECVLVPIGLLYDK